MGLSPRTATFSVATNTTTELVAAVAGSCIVVHALCLSETGGVASTPSLLSAAANISGTMRMVANGNITLGYAKRGYFATIQSEALNLAVPAAQGTVSGFVRYSISPGGGQISSVPVSVTAGNTTTIVTADLVWGSNIRVHAFVLFGSAAATVINFKDTAGNTVSNNLRTVADGNLVAPFAEEGYFDMGTGQRLDITATTGNVTGFLTFSQR